MLEQANPRFEYVTSTSMACTLQCSSALSYEASETFQEHSGYHYNSMHLGAKDQNILMTDIVLKT